LWEICAPFFYPAEARREVGRKLSLIRRRLTTVIEVAGLAITDAALTNAIGVDSTGHESKSFG